MTMYSCFIVFTIAILSVIQGLLGEEILGCGGFIKSHASIDYSKVHIKLYTKSGSLKDQTECAPNNGYYFLPLYDKGEYILKVVPPRGWSFEPTEISLDVDGTTDICSQGKDINFTFKGFGIAGRVTSSKSPESSGPSGVTVVLYKEKIHNDNSIGTTTTSKGGVFSFTPIQPGKYILVASHSVWRMEKNTVDVTVREGNTELPDNSLTVFGYDVKGRVITEDNHPVSGVSFVLFGTGGFKDCPAVPSSMEIKTDAKWGKPLCHVTSSPSGVFTFPALTNGNYRLIPHYSTPQTKFHVQPPELVFTVDHSSVNLPRDFKVTGFTVSGTVLLSSKDKIPLPNAKVFISGKQVATTDKLGRYSVDKMKTGQYSLKIEAPDVQFDEATVKISANSPELPISSPSTYKVCGTVTLSTKGTLHHRKVILENPGATLRREIETDPKTGDYCVFLIPGKYQFSVVVDTEEKTKGLQFFPLQQTIDVSGKPINNVNFLQLKAILSGSIKCLSTESSCNQAFVTLKILDGLTVKTIQAQNGNYEFSEVLPGHYEVLIDTDVFCWENPIQQISVTSEKASVPPFKQTGFTVTFISSHDSAVEFFDPGKSKKIALTLPMGSTRHCVSSPGIYKFIPKSCHIYSKEFYPWDTTNQNPIILTSNEHRHRGKILVPSSSSEVGEVDIKVKIETGEKTIYSPVKFSRTKDTYQYIFEFNANVDSIYVITPQSDIILFSPPSLKITGTNDCNNDAATFTGQIGRIIEGKISPALEGVTIKIFGKDKEAPVHTLVTQQDGNYRIGPLDGSVEYTVTAEKSGFSITRHRDSDGIFYAEKLAEVVVDVVDQDESPLPGVLLSLSGGQGGYRKNSVTGGQGQLVFNSLSSGEYYLRAVMKEYRFDPPSKIIKVSEGATVQIKLLAKRVAFSAVGTVTSLNGEPEPGLIVEAQGGSGIPRNSPSSSCDSLLEEATTEENGRFRIRGLEPGCDYVVRLKDNEFQTNSRVYRASPEGIDVQVIDTDVEGLRFIAFHPIPRTDLSVHVIADQVDHYRTLKVKLCREDQPDSPIHSVRIDPQQASKFNSHSNPGFLMHFPPLQSNGKKYFVQLESSLSTALYKYKVIPSYFEANTSFKALTLRFKAERKIDHGEMNQSSVIALPFIMLVAIAFLNREKLWVWLNVRIEQWSKAGPVQRSPVPQSIPIDPRTDDIIVEQIMNINKRKTKPRKT
ncbi:nodal modulator 1 [Fopius arisanus]|uniref:Nodal modulator 1 n=1 Tax=Fopius arisanus TaxID=64838 RepID=A0A0C9RG30_9HYME|nr:PREDICTED: nodal modulator 1 [Fopius arisanus]